MRGCRWCPWATPTPSPPVTLAREDDAIAAVAPHHRRRRRILAQLTAKTPTPRRTDHDDGLVPLRVPVGSVSRVPKPAMIGDPVATASSSMPSATACGAAFREATFPRRRLFSEICVSALSPASLDAALLASVCVSPRELHTPFLDKPCSIKAACTPSCLWTPRSWTDWRLALGTP